MHINGKFDPTISPAMINNSNNNTNYLNYNRGEQHNDNTGMDRQIVNNNSNSNDSNNGNNINNSNNNLYNSNISDNIPVSQEQLDNYIIHLNNQVDYNLPVIDYNEVKLMNSSQLESMINNISNSMIGGTSSLNNISQQENKNDTKEIDRIVEIDKKLEELNNTKNELLQIMNNIKNSQNETQIINKTKDQVDQVDQVDQDNSEQQINNKSISKINQKKVIYKDIIIKPDNDPQFYNDYMIELDDKYNNIISVMLKSYTLPTLINNVTDKNNKFYYIIGDEEHEENEENEESEVKCISINPGRYSSNNIVSVLQKQISNDNLLIKKLSYGYISIKHKKGSNFKIVKNENSINELLGFIQNNYQNENCYRSDEICKINDIDKIYLFLSNIVNDTPFAEINLKTPVIKNCNIIKKFDKKPIDELKDMVVKFKIDGDPLNDNFYKGFGDTSHELVLRLGIIE